MTNIAEKLKSLRIEHGLSQEKLAEQLMVSRQAVSKWENGEALPDMENMIALAKLYNTSLDELVGLTVDNPKNQNTPENSINTAENTTEDKNGKNSSGNDLQLVHFLNFLLRSRLRVCGGNRSAMTPHKPAPPPIR